MFEKVSSEMRTEIAIAKGLAFLGGVEDAIGKLEEQVSRSSEPIDQLAGLNTVCEILYLDFRDDEALHIFDKRMQSLLGDLPEKIEIAIAYNRSDVLMSMIRSDDFYAVVDRAKLSNVKLWDYQSIFHTAQAREKEQRFDSLPNTWRDLIRTYRQGCWRPYRFASRQMGIECMELGWPQEAVYHLVVAGEKEAAIKLGEFLLSRGSKDSISASVSKWLECTHLRRQFLIGCELIDRLADAVPDDQLNDVFERILKNAARQDACRKIESVVSRAWDLLLRLSPRLDSSQVQKLLETAIEHRIWNASIPEGNRVLTVRDKIMKALASCTSKVPVKDLSRVIEATLPLVGERMQHTDYPDGIDLLCALGHAGGHDAKQRIKEVLFPSGKQLDAYLLQVAPHFDVELKDPERLSKGAKDIADRIRLQVQTIPVETEVKQQPGTFGFHTSVNGDTKTIVQRVNAVGEHAILRHRKSLTSEAIEDFVDAVLSMIQEPENLISNRIQLTDVLAAIGDVCSDAEARKISNILFPIANGEITEPSFGQNHDESKNPLNPFKMGSGNPQDLRGVAIRTLSCIERDKPGVFGSKLDMVIESALTDDSARVRAFALDAAQQKPTISETEFTAIVLATRDADPVVANAAFGALTNKTELKLSRPQWRLLIHSARLATKSQAVSVRRAAAYTCNKLRGSLTTQTLKEELQVVLDALLDDRCASVRNNAMNKDD